MFILYLLTLGLIVALSSNISISQSQSSFNLYADNDFGLSLEYPSDWSLTENLDNSNNSTAQIAFVPNLYDDNNTIINFAIMPIGNLSLEDYAKFSGDFKLNNIDLRNLSSQITSDNFGNLDTRSLNLTYVIINEINEQFKVQEISTISDQNLYTATLVAPENYFKSLQPYFKSLVSSIRIS